MCIFKSIQAKEEREIERSNSVYLSFREKKENFYYKQLKHKDLFFFFIISLGITGMST